MSELHEQNGDLAAALSEYKRFAEMRKEVLNRDSIQQMNELHARFNMETKEKEAEIHRLKNVELRKALENLQYEQNRSEELLRNILPQEIADELKVIGKIRARKYPLVTVLFADISDFTHISSRMSPDELVDDLDFYFRRFDEIIAKYKLEKIKTIGDAYLCVGGLPLETEDHAFQVCQAAFEMIDFVQQMKILRSNRAKSFFEFRIGIHSGPVVAGIVGKNKFAYDIWGDTVNCAARMEQSGEPGRINVSGDTWALIQKQIPASYRGKIEARHKGLMDMYFLETRSGVQS